MFQSTTYVSLQGICRDCKCEFTGRIINEPQENTDVSMECSVSDFDPSYKHMKKRSLNGQKRVDVANTLTVGNMSSCMWRRNEADKLMDMFDDEPPHLYKETVLRKAKQERRDFQLKITDKNPIISLHGMKYGSYVGSIHSIGQDPFFVHYWTAIQIAIYLKYHDSVCIDATGFLVTKMKLPNGEV